MTKKDYVLIAEGIKEVVNTIHVGNFDPIEIMQNKSTASAIAYRILLKMEKENPRFNRAKFLQACGLK